MSSAASRSEVDVLVVGARVAGSVLASLLGRAGWRVIAVDRATFPSGTLSTHFFRGDGCAGVLQKLGLLDDVLALGAPPLVREYNADALDGSHTVDPPQDPGDVGFDLSVRRETLDGMLADRARREATVEIRERTSLRSLVRTGERVVGAEIVGDAGPEEVVARFVVGADGYPSRVAALVDAPIQEEAQPTRPLYYRYAHALGGPRGDPDGPEFSLGDDELAYVFPSDAQMACVAVSLNARSYREVRTDAAHAFESLVAAHPFIAPRAARADWRGRLLGCGPRRAFVRHPVGLGWALVGDASLHQDPWTGSGMDNASMHATFLAEALDAALSGRLGEERAMATYHRRRDQHAIAGFRETSELGRNLNAFRENPPSQRGPAD